MVEKDKVKCTYYLERSGLDMIDALEDQRRKSGMRTKRQCSRSKIIADAVRMLYEYECLGLSKVHPGDGTDR